MTYSLLHGRSCFFAACALVATACVKPAEQQDLPIAVDVPVVVGPLEVMPLSEDGEPDMSVDLGCSFSGLQDFQSANTPKGVSRSKEKSIAAGLTWLDDHQSPLGFWDSDGFMKEDRYPDAPASQGMGNPTHDVGLTGLAILAMQGNGNTLHAGLYEKNVRQGVKWLKDIQQPDGLFGEKSGNATLYNQAIATLALSEAYYSSGQAPPLKRPLKRAVNLILRARNPYGAWRYNLEPNGDNDSSITGWMVYALKSAEESMTIDPAVFDGAEVWFDSMQNRETGRVGYAWGSGNGPGAGSSRNNSAYAEKFPAQKSEALTAVALLARMFMTNKELQGEWKDHPNYALLQKQAELIAALPPKWNEEDGSIDFYYWHFGTMALHQWGGTPWRNWKSAAKEALLPSQRLENKKDNFYGSWDPVGPWGQDGGRIYSTAMSTMILEACFGFEVTMGVK